MWLALRMAGFLPFSGGVRQADFAAYWFMVAWWRCYMTYTNFPRNEFAGSLCALVQFSLVFMVSADFGNMTWQRVVQ